jgi:hypothetical protein
MSANYQPALHREQGGSVMRVRHSGGGRIVPEDDLWGNCPLLNHLLDPTIGVLLIEDFVSYNAAATTGDYILTQATQGTAAISTTEPGVLVLDSNSATVTQGANLQRAKSMFIPAAGNDIWFETKIKVDLAANAELFIGLSEIDTTIIGTSANSSANHIGWQCVTDDGVLLFTSEKAGTGATAAAVTLANDTYVTLGFYYDGTADTVQQYINGSAVGDAHVTANIPIVALYPSFVCQSDGADDPILHIAGYRVFQLR